jgi:vesicle transport through interaction with t-SNAREs protein 1
MSNDILRNYEQQFGILCADITSKISRSIHLTDKNASVSSIENLFQEAKEIIEQMELEIRDINSVQKRTPEQKDKYMNIINGYKTELTKLESEFNKQIKLKKVPSSFEIKLNDDDTELNELRHQNQTSINKMNSNLENGYKMVLESEEAGNTILSDLFSQREQMQRSRDRLREANLNLGKSSRIVGQMAQRLLQNKIVLFGMCLILLISVILIIYFLIRSKLKH